MPQELEIQKTVKEELGEHPLFHRGVEKSVFILTHWGPSQKGFFLFLYWGAKILSKDKVQVKMHS